MGRWRKDQMGDRQDLDIGQHWLIDEAVLSAMASHVQKGVRVVEIGAGKGQLTRKIAPIAKEVVAVEIDKRRFHDLQAVSVQHPNVKVVIADAQRIDFGKYRDCQIIGNIPYNITEPLITRLAGAPIKSAILMVGRSFAQEAASDDERSFGKLRLLVQTFFHAHSVGTVSKQSFDPPPRTESAILELVPRAGKEYKNNCVLFVERELFMSANRSPKIQSALREALIKFAKDTRGIMATLSGEPILTKNQARAVIAELDLPGSILDTSFEQLSNQEYQLLFGAIGKIHI